MEHPDFEDSSLDEFEDMSILNRSSDISDKMVFSHRT